MIKDDLIYDICSDLIGMSEISKGDMERIKKIFKKHNHEVEEAKSKLDEARGYKPKKKIFNDYAGNQKYVRFNDYTTSINLYEEAIKEIQSGIVRLVVSSENK